MRANTRTPRLAALLVPLVVAGCLFDDGGGSSGTGGSDAPAIELVPGDTLRTNLGTNPGQDTLYLAFHADSGSTYRLSVADSASRLKLAVANRDTVQQFTSSAVDFNKKNTLIDFPCTATGTYLLRVVGPSGATVKTAIEPRPGLPSSFVGPDAYEPDSTLHTASTIPADGNWYRRTGTSGTSGDVDWFRVKTIPGRTYTVEFKDSVVLYGTTRSLWSGDSATIGLPTTGTLEYASFDTLGFWFRTDCNPSGARYRVRVTETVGYPSGSVLPDPFESDDSLHPAIAKTDSSTLPRTLHGKSSSKDADWTEFDLAPGRTWTVVFRDSTGYASSSLSGLPAGLSASTSSSRASGIATTIWTIPAPTTIHALLRTSGSTAGGYVLQAWPSGALPDSIRLPDAFETDAVKTPMLLKTDSVDVSRNFHGIRTSSDTDWIALDVDSGRTYFLRLRDSAGNMRPEIGGIPDGITLVVVDGDTLGKHGSVATLSFPALSKGRVSLHLADSLVGGYTIAAWSHPGLPDSLLPEKGEPDDASSSAFEIHPDSPVVVKRVVRHDTDWISARPSLGSGAVLRVMNLGGGTLAWRPSPGAPIRTIYAGWTDSVTFLSPRLGRILAEFWNTDTSGRRIQYSLGASGIALPPDALEPDDAPGSAAPLVPGASFADRWTSSDDTDWMSLEVPQGRAAKVSWIGGSRTTIAAYSLALRTIQFLAAETRGDTTTAYLATPGKFLLKASANASDIARYAIRFDTVVIDPEEPNNSPSQARAIVPDSLPHSTILTTNDTDWFSFPVHAGWLYAVSWDNFEAGAAVFYQGSRVPLRRQFLDSAFEAPGEGTAYLALSKQGQASFPPKAQSFRFKVCPGDSLSAATDSLHPKTILPNSGLLSFALAPKADLWLDLPVKAGAYYSLADFTSNSPELELVGLFGSDTALWGEFMRTSESWKAPANGSVKFHLRSSNPFWQSHPDTMSFSLREDPPNPGAPNFDSAQALELPTDSSFQSRTFSATNTEYFKIRVEAGKQYTMRIGASDAIHIAALGTSEASPSDFYPSGSTPVGWDLGTAASDGYRTFKMTKLISPLVHYRIGVSSR